MDMPSITHNSSNGMRNFIATYKKTFKFYKLIGKWSIARKYSNITHLRITLGNVLKILEKLVPIYMQLQN